jgi:hypothetical protein
MRRFTFDEGEPVPRVEPDAALAPRAIAAHDLADGKRVEELVGDDDERALRNVFQVLVPSERNGGVGETRFLYRAQSRARFDQGHGGRGEQS